MIMADLLINGKDALATWGVRIDDGFLDSIEALAAKKDYITNSIRLKNGVDYCKTIPKADEREITLNFAIVCDTPQEYKEKKAAFFAELYKGDVEIEIPPNGEEVYFLKYVRGVSYAQNRGRTASKFSAKFKEPNPVRRSRE